ncbi:hypothetical protein GCM10009690_32750 [Brevibacterium permense]|uniref:DUF7507 domain-containing protein n=1 Tax=Brevibacterium permense TaxID=234834 RepID=A0ABN2AVK3_9MICO
MSFPSSLARKFRTPFSGHMLGSLNRLGSRTRALIASVLTLLLIAVVLPVNSEPAQAAPAEASPQALQCGPIYTMQGLTNTSQNLWQIDPASGGQTSRGTFGVPSNFEQINAMGMSADGSSLYGIYTQSGNREIFRYDTNTNSSQRLTRGPANSPITHGAVDPSSGIYYYGGFSSSTSSVLNVYGFNPSTGQSLGLVAQGTVPADGANGDFAFSSAGELYYIGANGNSSSTLGVVNQELPTTAQSKPKVIGGTKLTSIASKQPINGIAFGGDGLLYMSSGTTLYSADPTSGKVLGTNSFGQTGTTDMASCATPSTLRVQKDFSNGRFAPEDQATLDISGNGLEPGAPGNTGVTQGNSSGVQNQQPSEYAGSIIGRPGQTFQFSESGAGASQKNYKSTYKCVNQRNKQELTGGNGTKGSVTIPRAGADIVCTFANEAQRPGLSLQKNAQLNDSNGNGVADAGDTIDYTFTVTNTGQTILDNVAIDDGFDFDGKGISPSSVDGLKPEDSRKFTANYTVTQKDVDRGKDITNTATARGESPTGQTTTSAESKTNTPVATRAPGLSLQKTSELDDANGNNVADVGETIRYSFTVQNTGNTTLTDVAINDPLLDSTDPEKSSSLAPGAETTFSGSHKVTQGDIDANGTNGDGVIRNTATASGLTPGQDDPVKSDPSSTNTPLPAQNSSIALKKTSELDDSNSNNVADVDETIAYRFTVTNTGNTTLKDVDIADDFDFDGAGIDPASIDSLAPGNDASFTAKYTVRQSDVDAGGVIDNTATASATSPGGDAIESGQSSTETPVAEPTSAMSLKKDGKLSRDSNDNGLADVGDTFEYTFTVTNHGNTTLADITIDDDRIDSTDPSQISSLAPGKSAEFTAKYTVTQADIDTGGDIVNTATASGRAPNGNDVRTGESTDNFPTAGRENSVSLQKDGVLDDTNDNGTADAGETIDYTFTVKNNGNTTLTDVTVNDDTIDANTLSPKSAASLAPGEEATFTGSRQVTQADVNAGEDIVNTATATAAALGTNTPITSTEAVDNVPTTAQTNGLALQKTSALDDDKSAAEVGDVINFTFTVTNTGNTTVEDVSVADEFDFDSGIDPGSIESLAPGEQKTLNADYTVTQSDIDAGKDISNTASANGTAPNGAPVESNESTANTPVKPRANGVAISKTAELEDTNDNGVADQGETIAYTFVVTNTGNTTLTDVTIDDDLIDADTLKPKTADSLAPGEQATFTASFKVTQKAIDNVRDDGDQGIVNIAAAEAASPGGDSITSAEDTANVPLAPQASGLHLKKSGELQGDGTAATVGDTIDYTFVVTNTGNTTLTHLGIDDDRLDEVELSDPDSLPNGLAPGESATFSGSYTVTQADIDATESTDLINTATARGTTPGDNEIASGPSSANVPKAPRSPQLKLEKTGEIQGADIADVGDEIKYTFKVTNTGNTSISDVSIEDANVDKVEPANVGTVAPGDSATFTATYTVTQADVDAGGVENTATAKGSTPDDSAVEAVDTDSQPVVGPVPAMTLEKSDELQDENDNNAADAGETIQYTFTVENTGNVTLRRVTIDDVKVDDGTLRPKSVSKLAPGDKATFTASYTVTQADVDDGGPIVNTATAQTRSEGDQTPVRSNEDSTKTPVAEHDSALSLKKSNELKDENDNGAADVGETIEYSFKVTNSGNTTLSDVTVNDEHIDDGSLSPKSVASLAPDESATFTATHTVTQADVDGGKAVRNTATAEGTAPGDDDKVRSAEASTETPVADTDAALSIEKTADKDTLVAGDSIEYSFKITNTGNVTLSDVGVDEGEFSGTGELSPVNCSDDSAKLAPGDSVTCTAAYEVTQADVNRGSLDNSAAATGKAPNGDDVASEPSDWSITGESVPGLSVEKTADTNTFEDGESITYSFKVTNTGNVTLSDVGIDEAEFTGSGDLSEISCAKEAASLAPGDSVKCTAAYKATQADVDRGSIENSATAKATTPNGDDVDSDPSEVRIPAAEAGPAVSIEKTADKDSYKAGDSIEYSFKVTNNGNVSLSDVGVDESEFTGSGELSDVSCPDDAAKLAPGESMTCTATYDVVQSDVDRGSLENSATATGQAPNGDDVVSDPSEVNLSASDEDSDSSSDADVKGDSDSSSDADAKDDSDSATGAGAGDDSDSSSESDSSADSDGGKGSVASADAEASDKADAGPSADAGGSDDATSGSSSTEADTSSEAASSTDADSSGSSDGGGDLPRTGAAGIFGISAIALLLLAIGMVIVPSVRRRKSS